MGLLWWRLPEYEKRIIDDDIWSSWKKANVESVFMKKIQSMKGKLYESKYELFSDFEKALGKDWNQVLNKALPQNVQSSKRVYGNNITAYYADGYRGNYLAIVPESKIVAIRCADHKGFNYQLDFFPEFVTLVSKL